MKTLKTLKQALKLSNGQLTADNIINGRLYTSKGWESFKIDDSFKKEFCKLVANLLGGFERTKEMVFDTLYYNKGVNHWGLTRIIISERRNHEDKRKKIINTSYCAGQDYVWELNQIRTDLKRM